jgi:hypothetical protein
MGPKGETMNNIESRIFIWLVGVAVGWFLRAMFWS